MQQRIHDRFRPVHRLLSSACALAYANRRLNDNINTLLHLGEQQHLWAVSRERRGGPPLPCSSRTPAAARRTMTKACWDLSGEAGGTSAGTLPPKTAMSSSPQQSPWTMSKIVRQRILDARAERRKAERFQKRAGDAAMARANLSGATSLGAPLCRVVPPRLETLPDTIPSPTGATPTCPAATWMR